MSSNSSDEANVEIVTPESLRAHRIEMIENQRHENDLRMQKMQQKFRNRLVSARKRGLALRTKTNFGWLKTTGKIDKNWGRKMNS